MLTTLVTEELRVKKMCKKKKKEQTQTNVFPCGTLVFFGGKCPREKQRVHCLVGGWICVFSLYTFFNLYCYYGLSLKATWGHILCYSAWKTWSIINNWPFSSCVHFPYSDVSTLSLGNFCTNQSRMKENLRLKNLRMCSVTDDVVSGRFCDVTVTVANVNIMQFHLSFNCFYFF